MAVVKAEALRGHDHETASELVKALNGCEKPVDEGCEWEFGGYVFDRCPAFYVNDSEYVQDVFRLWNWREKGFLPFPGALMDQPNVYLEAMEYMDYLITERQKIEASSFKGVRRG